MRNPIFGNEFLSYFITVYHHQTRFFSKVSQISSIYWRFFTKKTQNSILRSKNPSLNTILLQLRSTLRWTKFKLNERKFFPSGNDTASFFARPHVMWNVARNNLRPNPMSRMTEMRFHRWISFQKFIPFLAYASDSNCGSRKFLNGKAARAKGKIISLELENGPKCVWNLKVHKCATSPRTS